MQPSLQSSFRTFSSSQKSPCPLAVHPHSHLQPQTITDLISISVNPPFQDSHINAIIQYIVFCIWFLPLSIMFWGFIHVVGYSSSSSLFLSSIVLHRIHKPPFVYPLSCSDTGAASYLLAIMNSAAMNIHSQAFV